MAKLPWLDYTGQTTAELIAAKNSHRIDSLMCAIEQGIQLKQQQRGQRSLTAAERLLLAVMALDREVNNGGYRQFFQNSSQFAPGIVDSLRRIGCDATAAVTAKAIAALGLPAVSAKSIAEAMRTKDPKRDRALQSCDKQFYRLREIEPRLFGFVEAHQHEIRLEKVSIPPPRRETAGHPNIGQLFVHLKFTPSTDRSLEGVRRLAEELAAERSIPATGAEVEGAAVLYLFARLLRAGDLALCEPLASRAFELTREETIHSILHRKWVCQLISASQAERADASTLAYLDYLKGSDPSALSTRNRIQFWAELLQAHPGALPRSIQFFAANFSGVPAKKRSAARVAPRNRRRKR
jgi:hypothetical protein